MQHQYLPGEIALEWLDGMIDYMPLYNTDGALRNAGHGLLYLEKKPEIYLKGYDRIKKTFTLFHHYEWPLVYSEDAGRQKARGEERRRLVTELFENVRAYRF